MLLMQLLQPYTCKPCDNASPKCFCLHAYVCGRWLLAKPVHGTLFADYGSDLDSGETVIGDPAGTRGKPGRQVSRLRHEMMLRVDVHMPA
jgi:hypothetical protein